MRSSGRFQGVLISLNVNSGIGLGSTKSFLTHQWNRFKRCYRIQKIPKCERETEHGIEVEKGLALS